MLPHLLLPRALCASPLAPLLLDKAVKAFLHRFQAPPEAILLPDPSLRLQGEAARNGLFCRVSTEIPDAPDPFRVWFGEEACDLRLPEGLCDWHAHTQFAYCGRGIDIQDATTLSFALGTEVQGFSEHAFALYFPANALKFHWQSDPEFVERVWRSPGRGRMAAYRAWVQALRPALGDRVRFGLEVDLFGGGRLCVAPDDLEGWDYLIGAVHEIEGIDPAAASDAEIEKAWLRDVERLLACPIAVLAHPFRYFSWYGRTPPRHLYRPVARRLAQAGVAAEINHHKNVFELDFFRACLEEGVSITLGTDAHVTRNAADFLPHLDTLAALGLTPGDLLRPPRR